MIVYLVMKEEHGGSDTPYGPECEWEELVAVFSTREKAERFIGDSDDEGGCLHVEEYEVDKMDIPREGIWCTEFSEGGTKTRTYFDEFSCKSFHADGQVRGNKKNDFCEIYVFAKNKEEALKKSQEIYCNLAE